MNQRFGYKLNFSNQKILTNLKPKNQDIPLEKKTINTHTKCK